MKKAKTLILTTILLALILAACSNSAKNDGNQSEEKKVVRIGCEATTPGWMQADEKGNLTGYDYDVWMEIGKRTGYEVEIQVMDWDGMWVMLDDGRLDTVAEQITVTDARKEKYHFSEPYSYNIISLLAAADNPNLQTMSDIKDGMTIACQANTSDEIIVDAVEKEYGVTLDRVFYDGMSVLDVSLGRCDLWTRAKTSCILTVKEVENLKILGDTNQYETNAYPFAKTESGEKLSEVITQTIQEMKADGTLKSLSEKWFDMDISEHQAES